MDVDQCCTGLVRFSTRPVSHDRVDYYLLSIILVNGHHRLDT